MKTDVLRRQMARKSREGEGGHPGCSQAYHMASFRLHGKIFYEESDYRTFLSDPRQRKGMGSPYGMAHGASFFRCRRMRRSCVRLSVRRERMSGSRRLMFSRPGAAS